MSSIITGNTTAYMQAAEYRKQKENDKTDRNEKNVRSEKTEESNVTGRKNEVKGSTYGNPKLSDEGLKYYESLKKKFGGMNFVLVSSDKKSEAEAIKGSFATPGRMTVLIDEDKIEKMASDKQYRAKIEATIANASSGLSDLKKQLDASGVSANAFGMTVDDGGNSKFFAVLKKSGDAQKKLIEKKAAKKKAEKKAEAKKAEKKEAKERLEKAEEEKTDTEETVTITADSMEELVKKVQEYSQNELTVNVKTEEEKKVGQSFDYSV